MIVIGPRIFIVAAVVLIVFGIIASSNTNLQLFGVWYFTWFMAAFLSFLVDILLGVFRVDSRQRTP
jgi:cytosine/uracil/thiamine/allantoin permease